MKRLFPIFFIMLITLLFYACSTTQDTVEEDLTPGEYFQKAQTAAGDQRDYEKALRYYETFLKQYPDQQLLAIEAEYEIAFLYYKMEKYDEALALFNKIIEKYRQPESSILPAWPEVLSKKLVEIIKNDTTPTPEKSVTEEE
jgi:outer membrane protein assembly factor BamD (BamD/ComL family)